MSDGNSSLIHGAGCSRVSTKAIVGNPGLPSRLHRIMEQGSTHIQGDGGGERRCASASCGSRASFPSCLRVEDMRSRDSMGDIVLSCSFKGSVAFSSPSVLVCYGQNKIVEDPPTLEGSVSGRIASCITVENIPLMC